jgi:uncharacterized membrane protein YraQ (UPF0718 family)
MVLQESINYIMYNIFSLNQESKIIESLNYFFYDSIKIVLLLFVMITAMGFLRSYISVKKVQKFLGHKHNLLGHLTASTLGAITPFCSCSSIPMFLSFLEMGVPLGTTLSFLITSPIVNEYLVVLMFGLFGLKITIAYVFFGIILGTISGMILGKLKLEKYLEKDFKDKYKTTKEQTFKTIKQRISFGLKEAISIIKKTWIWILVGVGVGALIHNIVPETIIHNLISKTGFFGVPIAVILGVPIYGSCAAIVPIALALFQKGMPLGTALSFMMAISALSLPQAIILRRAMKLKLIAIFFGIVTIGIIIVGYLFNILHLFL